MQSLRFILILSVLFTMNEAFASLELVFRNQTQVYSQRNSKSKVLTIYERGDRVPVSRENYGPWKKIIAEANGKKQVGWVLVRDLKGARIQEKKKDQVFSSTGERKKIGFMYKDRPAVGVSLNLSYYNQGSFSEELANVSSTTMNASGFSGMTIYPSVFWDYPFSSRTVLKSYFGLRSLERSGEAVYIPGNINRSTSLEQKALSLGATVKFYSSNNSWWGVGGEVAKVTESTVTATGISTNLKEDPLYFFIHASLGYDLNLYKNIYVLPEFKLGAAVNGSPVIINAEILIPVSYQF